jgi:uncharacterized membrane protein
MGKDRLAAFSDGVLAIIITIMVLELHVPHGGDLGALMAIVPSLLAYVLSFIYVAIYWNNHHHLLHTVTRVNGLILWTNSHLLFWLSIIPVATAWIGHNLLMPLPTAVYGTVLLMPAIAYYLLVKAIIYRHGRGLDARPGGRTGSQRENFGIAFGGRDCRGLCGAVGLNGALRGCGNHLDRAGPAD